MKQVTVYTIKEDTLWVTEDYVDYIKPNHDTVPILTDSSRMFVGKVDLERLSIRSVRRWVDHKTLKETYIVVNPDVKELLCSELISTNNQLKEENDKLSEELLKVKAEYSQINSTLSLYHNVNRTYRTLSFFQRLMYLVFGNWYIGTVETKGEYIHYMQVHDTHSSSKVDMVLYKRTEDCAKEYRKEDILEIIEEVDTSHDVECDYPEPYEFPVDHEAIKHLYHESDVYRFNNKDELILLYKSLNEPMISDVWDEDNYIDELSEDVFGVVFYWTEYDDWSCGHPYSYYMKIIFGVK